MQCYNLHCYRLLVNQVIPNRLSAMSTENLNILQAGMTKPIAYTVGEPAGIGADILLQLAQTESLGDIVVLGDLYLLEQRAQMLGLRWPVGLQVQNTPLAQEAVAGQPDTNNVGSVLTVLDAAIDGCLNGQFSAMVTGPLHKGIINDAGHSFSGHTEYLAQRTGAKLPVMMLATNRFSHASSDEKQKALRVALVTTHLPLKDVSKAITQDLVIEVCRIVKHDLRTKFGIQNPRLLVCGLNPHAGEGGHMGMEEIDTIIPALEKLKSQGMDVRGPLPADTLFTPKYLDDADIAIAMFHDQGLPVLKSHGFSEAANITLGLPIIRTSVDHGTAFDLAGSGKAHTGSLSTAISVAREMVGSLPA